MNYKKQIAFSLIFALIIGAISAFFFNYLPFDCSDPTLPEGALFECRTRATLGVNYWLPYSVSVFFFAIPFYWIVFGIIYAIGKLFGKKH